MRRLLSWFARTPRANTASSPRPRSFRPQLEQLDERLVPSTVSSAISFWKDGGYFLFTEHDWYSIDQTTGHVVEFTGTNRHDLPSGPEHVFAVSASLDPRNGYNTSEVFALGATNQGMVSPLWLYDSQGWHNLGGWYQEISATRDGHVYAVTWLGYDIRYVDSNGNSTSVGTPNGSVFLYLTWEYNSVAASNGRNGQNEVFAIDGKQHAIWVNSDNAPGQWRLVNNQLIYNKLSATTDNTVFAVADNTVYQETEQWFGNWVWTSQLVSPPLVPCWGISADIDANGKDEVYVIDLNNNAFRANQGTWTCLDGDVHDIAGADGGYFYDVNYYSVSYSAYLWNPNTQLWYYLGDHLS